LKNSLKAIFPFLLIAATVGPSAGFMNEDRIRNIKEAARESVVYIEVSCLSQEEDKDTEEVFKKNGIIVSEEGYILTSFISEEILSRIKVFMDSREYTARLVGSDKVGRISVIKIEPDRKLAPLKFSSSKTKPGDWLLGLYRLGPEYEFREVFWYNMVNGILPEGMADLLLLGAVFMNDGMVMVNPGGEVQGICVPFYDLTLYLTETRKMKIRREMEMMNAGLKCMDVSSVIRSCRKILKEGRSPEIAWLGVTLAKLTKAQAEGLRLPHRGVSITKVFKDSRAERAGLKANDIVFQVNGRTLPRDNQALKLFIDLVRSSPVDRKLKLGIVRDGEERWITVKPSSYPELKKQRSAWLGLTVQEINDAVYTSLNLYRNQGVLVVEVEQGSPAFHAELRRGDLLTRIQTQPLPDLSAWQRSTGKLQEEKADTIIINLYRGNEAMTRVIQPALGQKKIR